MIRICRRGLVAGLLALPVSRGLAEGLIEADRPPVRPLPDSRRVIARAGLPGAVRHALVDPDSGAVLDANEAAAPMPPASTMKALTALYAMARLGGGYRFRTRIIRSGDMLVLAGGGDPVLDTDGLARLAGDLVATAGPAPARFAVWGGALPRLAEITPAQDDHLAYNPSLSGMILNFNRVHLGWRVANGAVQMQLEARASRHSPRAYSITAAPDDQPDLFTHSVAPTGEHWSVARSALRRPGSRWLPVRMPELYAGDVFQTLCRAQGLVLPAPEVIADLPVGAEIAALDSPPLTDLLRDMLTYSTNLTAEAIGLTASGASDPATSAAAMQRWLRDQGLGDGFLLADHSGLSGQSRVSAEGLARALAMAEGAGSLVPLLKSDPLADDAGGAIAAPFAVSAKTGTLNFVSNLAGRIAGPIGQAGFAILCADQDRHAATSGQELPDGVLVWTRQAKQVQRDLLAGWAVRYLQDPVADLRR